ncbi:MAG: protein jag [Candidatus Doudnabacteria bacterium]|nr:protein jag [Candidatus Doudnabacteria bacterium]
MNDFNEQSDKKDFSEEIAVIIESILKQMGVEARVSIEKNINGNSFNIISHDSHLLIGQRGANLYALQTLAHNMAYKKFGMIDRFTVDVDDYKKKREWYLRETAKKALEHMKKTGRPVMLEPMPAHDRRVIHAFLSADFDYETESRGEEPNRRIVIKPKEKI